MTDFNISIEAGKAIRIKTAGKFCEGNIVVEATGGGGSVSLAPMIERSVTEIVDDTATSVGAWAFYQWETLETVSLGAVESIGDGAFNHCHSLKELTLPLCLKSLGSYVFFSCYSLSEITFGGTVAEWTAMDVNGIAEQEIVVHCTDGNTTVSMSQE